MQKIILWALSGLVSVLLLVNLALGLSTRGAISQIQAVQAQVANGPQMETVLRNLSIRSPWRVKKILPSKKSSKNMSSM